MKSKVYFSKGITVDRVKNLFKSSGFEKIIKPNEFVAIKIHFGDEGNKGFINPKFAKAVGDEIKFLGARPFLTDTNVLYKSRRANALDHIAIALEHGFGYENTGCPIIIADGLTGSDYKEIAINGRHFKNIKIANAALECDSIICLTHITGHIVSGFAGSIKNIGMGLASRGGKLMQHFGISPKISAELCKSCGKCIISCPQNAIEKNNNAKPKIIRELCIGCGECAVVCRYGAVEICWKENPKQLQERMVEYAYGIINLKKGKCGFVNFVNHVTANCDCLAKDEPLISADLGIFASTDIVALEKATGDLIVQKNKSDVFKKAYPDIDWTIQLEYAANLGLGSLDYDFIDI